MATSNGNTEGVSLAAADQTRVPDSTGWSRVGLIAYALLGGVAIFVGGTPYFEFTAANDSPIFTGALVVVFGLLALFLGRRPVQSAYATCSYSLFVAASAMLVAVIGPFNWLVTAESGSVEEATQGKLAEFLAVVPAILLITWATRRSRRSIYLQKGLPKRWLIFGLGSLVIAAIVVAAIARGSGISSETLVSAAPWILAFAALNAFMEELWFRSIFLRSYSASMGGVAAVLVTAVVFGLAHVGATYLSAGEYLGFTLLVVVLGIVLAWAMRWANSMWGAVLFHMGLDLVVVLELLDAF